MALLPVIHRQLCQTFQATPGDHTNPIHVVYLVRKEQLQWQLNICEDYTHKDTRASLQ